MARGGKLRSGFGFALCPLDTVTFCEIQETFLTLLSLRLPICEIKIRLPTPLGCYEVNEGTAVDNGALGSPAKLVTPAIIVTVIVTIAQSTALARYHRHNVWDQTASGSSGSQV